MDFDQFTEKQIRLLNLDVAKAYLAEYASTPETEYLVRFAQDVIKMAEAWLAQNRWCPEKSPYLSVAMENLGVCSFPQDRQVITNAFFALRNATARNPKVYIVGKINPVGGVDFPTFFYPLYEKYQSGYGVGELSYLETDEMSHKFGGYAIWLTKEKL